MKPLLKSILKKIKWLDLVKFAVVLSITCIILASTVIHNRHLFLHALIFFWILVAYLVIDVFIEEYQERAKSKSKLRKL